MLYHAYSNLIMNYPAAAQAHKRGAQQVTRILVAYFSRHRSPRGR